MTGCADQLVAFVAGSPISVALAGAAALKCAEINFYCVHTSLRYLIAIPCHHAVLLYVHYVSLSG